MFLHRFAKPCFLFLLLLTGCMPFQSFKQLRAPVTNHWSVPVAHHPSPPSHANNITFMHWWKAFHDKTLNELMIKTLHCNDSVQMARARIEAAQGELKKIQYQWIPDVDAFGGYSNAPMWGFPGYWYTVLPRYTLNLLQQIKRQKIAEYELIQAKAETNVIKLTVIAQLSASYFTYLAEIERRALLNTLAKDRAHYANIAEKVYRDGLRSNIYPQEPDSRTELTYGQQEILERNIVVSRNAIQYLTEQEPGPLPHAGRFSDIQTDVIIPGQLPLTVLANRPDLMVAETHLRAANEGIGLAFSGLLPTMHLDLYAGKIATNSLYSTPKKTIYVNNELFNIPLLKLSVLGDIAKARGLNKESYYNYIDTLLNALKNTTNALSSYDRLTKRLQRTRNARAHLAKAYRLNKRLYEGGIQSYARMLDSKIRLDQINLTVNRDKLQQLLAIVRLYEQLAGGYRPHCAQAPHQAVTDKKTT